jgi:hypothetical protein
MINTLDRYLDSLTLEDLEQAMNEILKASEAIKEMPDYKIIVKKVKLRIEKWKQSRKE